MVPFRDQKAYVFLRKSHFLIPYFLILHKLNQFLVGLIFFGRKYFFVFDKYCSERFMAIN